MGPTCALQNNLKALDTLEHSQVPCMSIFIQGRTLYPGKTVLSILLYDMSMCVLSKVLVFLPETWNPHVRPRRRADGPEAVGVLPARPPSSAV